MAPDSMDPMRTSTRNPLQIAASLLFLSAASFAAVFPMEHDTQPALGAAAAALVVAGLILKVRAPWVKHLLTVAIVVLVLFTAKWISVKAHTAWRVPSPTGIITYVLLGNVVVLSLARWLLNSPSLSLHFATAEERAILESKRGRDV